MKNTNNIVGKWFFNHIVDTLKESSFLEFKEEGGYTIQNNKENYDAHYKTMDNLLILEISQIPIIQGHNIEYHFKIVKEGDTEILVLRKPESEIAFSLTRIGL